MKNTEDFLNKPLAEVVTATPGAKILHEVDVPGRKMMGVVVAEQKGGHVLFHCFGVRKSDGVITTRFDTPRRRLLEHTSLGEFPTLDPEKIKRWELNVLRNAARNRLSRNFFRRIVKTPELLNGGLEYYAGLTETQFIWALVEQVAILTKSGRSNTPHFPDWQGTFSFELDGNRMSCWRTLKFNPETNEVSAAYTFIGGKRARYWQAYGAVAQGKVVADENTAIITLYTVYPQAQWEKTDLFVKKNEEFLRQFFTAFPVPRVE